MIKVTIDQETITDAGFDRYLSRSVFEDAVISTAMPESRTIPAENIVGGVLGSEGVIYVGSKNIKIDGKNKRILISDGTTDRILIGYQKGGF